MWWQGAKYLFHLPVLSQVHYWGAGLEATQAGLEPCSLIGNISIAGSGSTHCITASTLSLIFKRGDKVIAYLSKDAGWSSTHCQIQNIFPFSVFYNASCKIADLCKEVVPPNSCSVPLWDLEVSGDLDCPSCSWLD